MREFVSAGGELIIHVALHSKKSPIPDLANLKAMLGTSKSKSRGERRSAESALGGSDGN